MTQRLKGFSLEDHLAARARWEPLLDAWAHVEDAGALRQADHLSGQLAGVPFGIKDVIDVQGQPSRYGSEAFEDAQPSETESPVVTALRDAGAIPVGKTRSTEFAFIYPTTTRNPYDPKRSPGGSSSGSGAVVGAGVVPFALGTQTAGSLCRPATYCGAYSYKPGLGVLPRDGMSPLSPSFDAIGVIAQSADWLEKIYDVLAAAFEIPQSAPAVARPLRIGFVNVPDQQPEDGMVAMISRVRNVLSDAGHAIVDVDTPVSFDDIIQAHRTVMLYEMAWELRPRVGGRGGLLKPLFRAALAEGAEIPSDQLDQAVEWLTHARENCWSRLSAFDLLMAYPVPGSAPIGLTTTGDQTYLTPWTAMGGPLVSVPSGLDRDGMPLGILLAATPGKDSYLMGEAMRLAGLLPEIATPALPVKVTA